MRLLLLSLLGLAAACQYNTSTFSCLEYTCPQDRVVCIQNNFTLCHCADGYLWRHNASGVCDYKQFSKDETLLWQGLFMLIGVSGAGLTHIGLMYGVGQIIFSVLGVCLLALIGGFGGGLVGLEGAGLGASCLACLGLLTNVIWWAVSMAQISSGHFTDGQGCPLA